jgi:SAM-dependent methyltransferase
MEKDEYLKMYDLETSYWWFLGKQSLVKDQIGRLPLQGFREVRLLDIGAGTGIIMKVLERFGKVCGVELSLEAIRFLKRRNLESLVRSDANEALPFRNEAFSVVTCLDVLEHLDKDFDLIQEMFRICKPGGYVILTIPAFQAFWSAHDKVLHHRRRYTKARLLAIIKQTDFRILKLSYYNVMMSIPILLIRKIRSSRNPRQESQSDFSIRFPSFFNRALTYFYRAEISLLKFLSYPFGVSLMVTLQKPGREGLRW